MTEMQCATYRQGPSFCALFPANVSYQGPADYYRQASQTVTDHQLKYTLQVPSLEDSTHRADGSALALPDMASGLSLESQCTIWDSAAMKASLTFPKHCSKQALRRIALQMAPSKPRLVDTKHEATSNSIEISAIMGVQMPTLHTAAHLELPVPVWPKAKAQVLQCPKATHLA